MQLTNVSQAVGDGLRGATAQNLTAPDWSLSPAGKGKVDRNSTNCLAAEGKSGRICAEWCIPRGRDRCVCFFGVGLRTQKSARKP
eukprot:789684-Rhodomonas_salina.1